MMGFYYDRSVHPNDTSPDGTLLKYRKQRKMDLSGHPKYFIVASTDAYKAAQKREGDARLAEVQRKFPLNPPQPKTGKWVRVHNPNGDLATNLNQTGSPDYSNIWVPDK